MTSATTIIYGETIWDPVDVLTRFTNPAVLIIAMAGAIIAGVVWVGADGGLQRLVLQTIGGSSDLTTPVAVALVVVSPGSQAASIDVQTVLKGEIVQSPVGAGPGAGVGSAGAASTSS